MPEQQFAPDNEYKIPLKQESVSALEIARARWGVAEVLSNTEIPANMIEVEDQSNHIERIKTSTHTVLAHRQTRLDQVLDIDIPTKKPLFEKIMAQIIGQPLVEETPRGTSLRQLIQMESRLGAQILGVVPAYDRREFYCFDGRMWIWHEERMNAQTGKHDVTTVSYNITDMGILKTFGDDQSRYVVGDELRDFAATTEAYLSIVRDNLYSQNQDDYTLAA